MFNLNYFSSLCRDLLQLFVTAELIKWAGLCNVYESELRSDATDVFLDTEAGNNNWTQLKNRVVEHVRIIIII